VEYNLPSYAGELAIRDPEKRWMGSSYFMLASCLCGTWPYRWLLNSSKNDYRYRIVKKILVSPTYSQPIEPAGLPAAIGILNEAEKPAAVKLPITPPPPYEA